MNKQSERQQVYIDIDQDPLKAYKVHTQSKNISLMTLLPDHMHGGICRYLLLGIKPGSFLTAVIAHEFEIAKFKADDLNATRLSEYRRFMDAEWPVDSHGSPEDVRYWCEKGGLVG